MSLHEFLGLMVTLWVDLMGFRQCLWSPEAVRLTYKINTVRMKGGITEKDLKHLSHACISFLLLKFI